MEAYTSTLAQSPYPLVRKIPFVAYPGLSKLIKEEIDSQVLSFLFTQAILTKLIFFIHFLYINPLY